MKILDNFIIVSLIVGAFISGFRLAQRLAERAAAHEKYALQKQYARLQAGVDADDVMQPYIAPPQYKHRFAVNQEFAERLNENGQATIRVNRHA